MGFSIRNLFRGRKDENAPGFRRRMAKGLNGRRIRFVMERTEGADGQMESTVIGHEGALVYKEAEDEILICASEDVVFRGKAAETAFSELLSMEGVIVSGHDLEHGGAYRSVIAYYTDYVRRS